MIKRLDSLSFRILAALFDRFVGAKIGDVLSVGSIVLLNIRSRYIYFSLDNAAIAFGLVDNPAAFNQRAAKSNTTIEQLLKKYLLGGTIIKFEQPSFDRKFIILVENYNFAGSRVIYKLEFASYGAYSNLWLWQDGELVGSYRNYQPPEAHYDYSITDLTTDNIEKLIVNYYNEEPDKLLSHINGLYPALTKYIASLCSDAKDAQSLYNAIKQAIDEYEGDPIRLWQKLYAEDITADGLNKDILTEIVISSINKGIISLKNKHITEYKKKIATENKNLAKLNDQLNTYQNAERVSMDANLLKGEIYKYKDKSTPKKVTVYDYDGSERVIELDTGLSLTDNMNRLYSRYRKYKRGIDLVNAQIENRNKTIEELEEHLFWLEKATTLAEIEELTQKGKKVNSKVSSKAKVEWIKIGDTPWRYTVGTNANLNKLILSQAKDTDIWFHGHNIPSGHLILRHDNPREADIDTIPDDVILLCANTVADNSSVANDKKVSIIYTQYKYVRKVPDFTSLVTYTHEKNIIINRGAEAHGYAPSNTKVTI